MELVDWQNAADLPAARIGGKARNLALLARAGADVPPWFCVTTALLERLRARLDGKIAAALARLGDDNPARAHAASEEIRALFTPALLGDDERDALLARFDALFAEVEFVSVRSSAVGEDSARDSFAGQMDSYLYVTRATLVERVLACLGSAFSARALVYRRKRGLGLDGIAAAAIVQAMVDSRVAGVLFTVNPANGDRNQIVISAGLGLGEGVVGDLVESDTYFFDRAGARVAERTIAEKRGRVVFDRVRGSGTTIVAVGDEEGRRAALSDAEVAALAEVGARLEAAFDAPQDIEWAIDAGQRRYILQTRAVTTLERETIFDNSNIVESYPGLSLPLTFSFARSGYRETFRAASRALGTSEADLAAHTSVHENLVALVDGRIYYNILNWYQLFLLLPGLERAIPAWEKALGIERRLSRKPPRAPSLSSRLRVLVRLVSRFLGLQKEVDKFAADFARVEADFKRRDLDALDAHELVELYERIVGAMFGPYSISVVNDFFAQQLYEVLLKLCARYQLGEPMALRNDLMCAESGMDSVEPVRSILALTDRIRADARLRALFEGKDARALLDAVAADPAHGEFRAALERHLDLYGDRTLEELKLETRPMRDDPELLVAMFRNYLRGEKIAILEGRERQIRERAEAAVAARLRFSPLRRALFGYVLRHARAGLRNRENLRLLRARGFGFIKKIFRALAARLVRDGLLGEVDDVFYLTVDEVVGLVRGHAVTRDLFALVALRKREYDGFRGRAPAPRLSTRGVVYRGSFERAAPRASDDATELRGVGCSPGRVRAPAKVILSPDQDLDIRGEILVAPMTDPGWVFLMVAASGIVSEKGSILSHTAIIGRELGIPTVVGVTGATGRIANGQVIELDGQEGRVRLIP